MKDRKKPEKFWLPHGMPSDDRAFAFSSRVFPKASQIKTLYKLWHYQFIALRQFLSEYADLLRGEVFLIPSPIIPDQDILPSSPFNHSHECLTFFECYDLLLQ